MSGDINNVFQKLCYKITMIYLISIPDTTNYHYWVITDTVGASLSASTITQAITNFTRQTFMLKDRANNYTITEHEVLKHGKFHGHILAKANTIQSLTDNYPEYFI